ncbi:hypothetical protein [Microbacterium sp. TNHR37B]|uniref:hypothetical protein n=1 Tax=Microbacterium sp. TNHR37B TaxID=1775956 RepID=UPI0007B20DBC|nr:hypothetical protein [Microbacterium sp. TNHR37B]KZE90238.1 hypothetical protein AVP41_01651 [Microbacterium sp. TNHR37B]
MTTGSDVSSSSAREHRASGRDIAAVITLWIRLIAVAVGLALAALYVLSGRAMWAIISTAVLVAASSWLVWLVRTVVARHRA